MSVSSNVWIRKHISSHLLMLTSFINVCFYHEAQRRNRTTIEAAVPRDTFVPRPTGCASAWLFLSPSQSVPEPGLYFAGYSQVDGVRRGNGARQPPFGRSHCGQIFFSGLSSVTRPWPRWCWSYRGKTGTSYWCSCSTLATSLSLVLGRLGIFWRVGWYVASRLNTTAH